MYCSRCGFQLADKTRYCPRCGTRKKRSTGIIIFLFLAAFLSGSFFGISFILSDESTSPSDLPVLSDFPERAETIIRSDTKALPMVEKRILEEEQKRELTEIIADAQKTVYTVFTSTSQGSGFLYNSDGTIVTNAHVVEGAVDVFVKTIEGEEYRGKVIGYSNETDVAIITVPDLVGVQPFPLNTKSEVMIGEEVIALGSPLGLENTATMGYVTGADRNFVIDSYVYNGLYQISAPISPGSSGGPLLSKNSEEIIAINSAQNIDDTSIGFSIPLYKVNDLLLSWVNSPMSEEEVVAQFHSHTGGYFFDDLWSIGEGYFDGGNYSFEEDFYHYWEYGFEEFWNDFGFDNYYEEWFSGYLEEWFHDYWYEFEDDWNYDDDWFDEYWDSNWEDDWYYEDDWDDE